MKPLKPSITASISRSRSSGLRVYPYLSAASPAPPVTRVCLVR